MPLLIVSKPLNPTSPGWELKNCPLNLILLEASSVKGSFSFIGRLVISQEGFVGFFFIKVVFSFTAEKLFLWDTSLPTKQ